MKITLLITYSKAGKLKPAHVAIIVVRMSMGISLNKHVCSTPTRCLPRIIIMREVILRNPEGGIMLSAYTWKARQ